MYGLVRSVWNVWLLTYRGAFVISLIVFDWKAYNILVLDGGYEITDKLARDGSVHSVQKFVGPVPSLGVSRQNIRREIKIWLEKQHLTRW